MSINLRTTAATTTLLVLVLMPEAASARQQRDTLRGGAATSAEELHRLRREWLERQRLGQLGTESPVFGSAVVGAPGAGVATGIATGPGVAFGGPVPGGALHCSALVFGGGRGWPGGWSPGIPFGGSGTASGWVPGGGWLPGLDPFGLVSFQGQCLPLAPSWGGWTGRGSAWRGPGGADGWRSWALPYPAYPPVGRFYDRFHPDDGAQWRGGSGWPLPWGGIQEFGWGPYGPWRSYPGGVGWQDGAYGWSFSPGWAGSGPTDCVIVTLRTAGREHSITAGLQPLGLADARDLDLAIDARLSRGEAVVLQGLDGRILRIEPGTPIDDILIQPCAR